MACAHCTVCVRIHVCGQCVQLSVSVCIPDWHFSSCSAWLFFSQWSFSRSLRLLCCFTCLHSTDEHITVLATTAGRLPNQVPSSLLYCSPLTLHVGTQTHMHTLLMHSFLFSSTGSFWGWRDNCCTLLASKLNCTEVNQAVYTWLSNHSLLQNILFIKH